MHEFDKQLKVVFIGVYNNLLLTSYRCSELHETRVESCKL